MHKQVKFEDNIFILEIRIRIIRDIITLDADPELFLEKTLDDISFTDQTLRILLGYLQENNRLIERDELLEQLSGAEWHFSEVLQALLDHEGNISVREIPAMREKLLVLKNGSLDRRKAIDNLSPAGDNPGTAPIVSSDELTELLKAF